MEVFLKKVKITSVILNQVIRIRCVEFDTFQVLGWCIYKNIVWIVFYKSSTNELRKFQSFKSVEEEVGPTNTQFKIKINIGGNFIPLYYYTDSKEENDKLITILNKVKFDSERKGQFYL